MSTERYIEQLNIADDNLPTPSLPTLSLLSDAGRTRGNGLTEAANSLPENLQAAVDVGSLLSFVSGTTPQERDDTLFSVQLAQRAASGRFDRFEQTESWYRLYLEVLENLGWTAAQKLTLNTSLYAQHREAVRKKLGASALEFIADLELG